MATKQNVSLRDANQHLSRYVRDVEAGAEVVITRRGRPVARIVPVQAEHQLSAEQQAALARTVQRMKRGYSLGGQAPQREDLYDR